jgi:CubicO group peptidase (beta-lactamase class C family)
MRDISKQVDSLFAEWNKKTAPGCALGVISKGKFIYKRCYGMANLEDGVPLTPDSVFDVASTSKQFTAACVAMLARRRKLSLDDRIQKHLPEIPEYNYPITIRHLIHHTSGLRDYLTLMTLSNRPYTNDYPSDEIFGLIARQKGLNFRPGAEHMYCNTGYFLLGEIVKRVSGLTLRQYAHKNIFAPLGMTSTHFHDDYSEIIPNRACGYAKGKKGPKTSISILDVVGDGGLYTTLNDLAIWDRNFYDNRLGGFGQSLIGELTAAGRLNNGECHNYAFGLFTENYRGLKAIHHGGSWVGYRSELIRFPEQRFSVICLANSEAIDAIALARKVADLYLAGKFPLSGPTPSKHKAGKKIPLAGRAGYYIHEKTEDLVLLSDKDGCSLELNGRALKLNRLSASQLEAVNGACRVEFTGPKQLCLTLRNGNKNIYSWLPKVKANPAQTLRHAGEYYCSELDITQSIAAKGKALRLLLKGDEPQEMLEVKKDLFKAGPYITIRFNRPARGNFTLSTGRVKDLHFVRR